MKKKISNITLSNNDRLVVINKGIVTIESSIELINTNTTLPVQITADFSNIPAELQHQYYQALAHQYHKDIKVYSNIHPDETLKCNIVKPWYKRLFK